MSVTKYYLLQDDSGYYTYTTNLVSLGFISPTAETYVSQGFSDTVLATIPASVYSSLVNPKLCIYIPDQVTVPSPVVTPGDTGTMTTTSTTSISLTGYSGIMSINIVDNNCKYLVSFDGRVTWKSFSNGAWSTVIPDNIAVQGMTSATVNALTPIQWGQVFSKTQLDLMVCVGTMSTGILDTQVVTNIPCNTSGTPRHLWQDDSSLYVSLATAAVTCFDKSTWSKTVIPLTAGYMSRVMWGDSTNIYIFCTSGTITAGYVVVIDRSTNTVSTTITLPAGVVNSTDNSSTMSMVGDTTNVYVCATGSPPTYHTTAVACIKRSDNTVSSITVGSDPSAMYLTSSYLYVSNYSSGSVSCVRRSDNNITTVSVATNPIAVWGDATNVYVANYGSGTVSCISTSTNTVVSSTATGANPIHMWGDVNYVYTVNYPASTVSCIRRSDGVSSSIPIPGAPRRIWGDSTYLYVPAYSALGYVTVVRRSDNAVLCSTPTDSYPIDIQGDATSIYTANFGSSTISRIILANIMQSKNLVYTPGSGASLNNVWGDAKQLYVCSSNSNTVTVINRSDNSIAGSFSCTRPWLIWGDSQQVYVVPTNGNTTMYIINRATQVMSTLTITATGFPVDIWGDANVVYVLNSSTNKVMILNRSTQGLTYVTVGTTPYSFYVDANYIYTANYGAASVSRISRTTNEVTTIATGIQYPNVIWGDSTHLFVNSYTGSSVYAIKLQDNSATQITTTASPLAIWGDSQYVYVAGRNTNQITRIDRADYTTLNIAAGSGPNDTAGQQNFGMYGDDKYVYVLNALDYTVTCLRKSDNSMITLPTDVTPYAIYADKYGVYSIGYSRGYIMGAISSTVGTYTGLTITLPPNQAPVINSPAVDLSTVHLGTLRFTATLTDVDEDPISYRILVNGVEARPWTAGVLGPVNVAEDLNVASMIFGTNDVRIETKDNHDNKASYDTYVTRVNGNPSITAILNRLQLNATLGDPDNDMLQYQVLINGIQKYPQTGWSNLQQAPVSVGYTFDKADINIGVLNTVTLNVKDQFGGTSTWSQSFTGAYIGLMFMDTENGYYTDDRGNVLKYLDFGSYVAGSSSSPLPVVVKNQTGYPLNNVRIWVDPLSLPVNTSALISPNADMSGTVDTIYLPGTLADGSSATIYAMSTATKSAMLGGMFKLCVRGDLT